VRAMQQATITFDRISTREELFEVIELLCKNGRSEFTRSADETGRGQSDTDLSAFSAALSQDTLEDAEGNADGELLSLEGLLLGQSERLN
jgi:hypothetical protein